MSRPAGPTPIGRAFPQPTNGHHRAEPHRCAHREPAPQGCSLAAQLQVVITRPDAVVYDMPYCTPHAAQVVAQLPLATMTHGRLKVELRRLD